MTSRKRTNAFWNVWHIFYLEKHLIINEHKVSEK